MIYEQLLHVGLLQNKSFMRKENHFVQQHMFIIKAHKDVLNALQEQIQYNQRETCRFQP